MEVVFRGQEEMGFEGGRGGDRRGREGWVVVASPALSSYVDIVVQACMGCGMDRGCEFGARHGGCFVARGSPCKVNKRR